ncbi:hypothetical protein [Pseudomonas putida]
MEVNHLVEYCYTPTVFHRNERILRTLVINGHERERVMVSDCGAFALLVYHLIPENRALRRWLSCEVLPQLRLNYH